MLIYRQGIPTSTTTRLVVRGDTNGTITLEVGGTTYSSTVNTAVNDGITHFDVTGSGSFVLTDVGGEQQTGTLRLFPISGFTVVSWSCDTPKSDASALYRMAHEADCGICLGDAPYLNTNNNEAEWGGITGLAGSTDDVAASANTANYLAHHLRQWFKPSTRYIGERMPFCYMPDDHEHPNNDWTLDTTGSNEAGVLAYNQGQSSPCTTYAELVTAEAAAQAAIAPYTLTNRSDTGELYFKFRPNDDVEVFVLDCVTHKNLRTAADGDRLTKFILGDTQTTWLVNALDASTATFKIIASPKRAYDSSQNNADGWISYPDELNYILGQIDTNSVTGVIWMCGDRHNTGLFASEAGVGGATYDHVSIAGCPISQATNHNVGTYNTFQKLGMGGNDQGQNYLDSYNKIHIPPGAAYADIYLMNSNGSVICRERVLAGTNKLQDKSEYQKISIS